MNLLLITSIIIFVVSVSILINAKNEHIEISRAWEDHFKLTLREPKKGTATIVFRDGSVRTVSNVDVIQERSSGNLYLFNKYDEVVFLTREEEVVSMEFSKKEGE